MPQLAGINNWMDIFGWRLGLSRVVIETILSTDHLSSDTVSMILSDRLVGSRYP